jgi:hypothetical protein
LVRSLNAVGRHSGEFERAAILGHQLIPIGAGRATGDTPITMIAGKPDGSMPRSIVGHWTLDGKCAAVGSVMVRKNDVSALAVAHSSTSRKGDGHLSKAVLSNPDTAIRLQLMIEILRRVSCTDSDRALSM